MTEAPTALESLRLRFPWPAQGPDVAAVPWVMDYGGRDLIRHLIAVRQPHVIVEIGAFMGGSVRQWLAVSPNVTVVAIDPWPQKKSPNPFSDGHSISRHMPTNCEFPMASITRFWQRYAGIRSG